MDDCLSEEVLSGLAAGSLDDAQLKAVEAHVFDCAKCMRRLSALADSHDGVSKLVEQAVRELDVEAPLSSEEPAVLARGTQVGRYEIIASIGAGGMGRVYAARDPTLGRKLALKLLHPSSTTANLEARLLREAQAMARLSHPEVIGIHDVGRYGDQLFIAMELVDGGTLRQWLGASPRTWKEVLAVFLRAGRGLAQAHAAGIVHRDFKPDNVLVGKDGRVRVTDFGLARADDLDDGSESVSPSAREARAIESLAPTSSPADAALTRTGALLGTPAYMAPEQHAGAPADVRSDIYSFCVALYEGLLGRRPFVEVTVAELYARKLWGPPAARGGGRTGVPDRIVRVVVAGLAPKPADRYASMDVLMGALERAQGVGPGWPLLLGVAAGLLVVGGVVLEARRGRTTSRVVPIPVTAPVECTTNRACVDLHGGAPFVCRPNHTCAAIASEDCIPKFEPGDLEAEDTVWLGAMFPAKGEASEFGAVQMHTVDFARREIAQTTQAFSGAGATQRLRRIAVVACDDSTDATRAAHHLVDDVGVSAVLGFRSGQEVIDLAGSLLSKAGVVSIATLTANPLVTRIPQPVTGPRLVWRTATSFDAAGGAIARFIEDVLEPRAKGRPTRVTLAHDETPGAVSIGDKFYRQLRFNGRPALENGEAYNEVTFSAPSPEELERAARRIVATRPTFLVLQGNESWTSQLVRKVETSTLPGVPKPTYIWAIGSGDALDGFVGRDVDRRRRTFAVDLIPNEPTNARFVIRYNQDHQDQVTRDVNGGQTYDAVYLLAYAVFAQGDGPVTGVSLASAFAKLIPPGRPTEVGPSDLFDGVTALASGASIDLAGTATLLDFDLTTGEAPAKFALFCMGVSGTGEASGLSVLSGVTYEARSRRSDGTLHCP